MVRVLSALLEQQQAAALGVLVLHRLSLALLSRTQAVAVVAQKVEAAMAVLVDLVVAVTVAQAALRQATMERPTWAVAVVARGLKRLAVPVVLAL